MNIIQHNSTKKVKKAAEACCWNHERNMIISSPSLKMHVPVRVCLIVWRNQRLDSWIDFLINTTHTWIIVPQADPTLSFARNLKSKRWQQNTRWKLLTECDSIELYFSSSTWTIVRIQRSRWANPHFNWSLETCRMSTTSDKILKLRDKKSV